MKDDLISRQAAIDAIHEDADWLAVQGSDWQEERMERDKSILMSLPSAQPEIVRCRECKFGEQDEVGRWFCRSLGCQIGNEDGSGFCADAERRTDE